LFDPKHISRLTRDTINGFGFTFSNYWNADRSGLTDDDIYFTWISDFHSQVAKGANGKKNKSGVPKRPIIATYRPLDYVYMLDVAIRHGKVPTVETWILLTIWRCALGAIDMNSLLPAQEMYFLIKKIENMIFFNNAFVYQEGTDENHAPYFVYITDEVEHMLSIYPDISDMDASRWREEGFDLYVNDVNRYLRRIIPATVTWISNGIQRTKEVDVEFIVNNYFIYGMDDDPSFSMNYVDQSSHFELQMTKMECGSSKNINFTMTQADILQLLDGWFMTDDVPRYDIIRSVIGSKLQPKTFFNPTSYQGRKHSVTYNVSSIKTQVNKMDGKIEWLTDKTDYVLVDNEKWDGISWAEAQILVATKSKVIKINKYVNRYPDVANSALRSPPIIVTNSRNNTFTIKAPSSNFFLMESEIQVDLKPMARLSSNFTSDKQKIPWYKVTSDVVITEMLACMSIMPIEIVMRIIFVINELYKGYKPTRADFWLARSPISVEELCDRFYYESTYDTTDEGKLIIESGNFLETINESYARKMTKEGLRN